MKYRLSYNKAQDITLEDFINEEYNIYVLEDDNKLDKKSIELKNAWKIILKRLELYGVIVMVKE